MTPAPDSIQLHKTPCRSFRGVDVARHLQFESRRQRPRIDCVLHFGTEQHDPSHVDRQGHHPDDDDQ